MLDASWVEGRLPSLAVVSVWATTGPTKRASPRAAAEIRRIIIVSPGVRDAEVDLRDRTIRWQLR